MKIINVAFAKGKHFIGFNDWSADRPDYFYELEVPDDVDVQEYLRDTLAYPNTYLSLSDDVMQTIMSCISSSLNIRDMHGKRMSNHFDASSVFSGRFEDFDFAAADCKPEAWWSEGTVGDLPFWILHIGNGLDVVKYSFGEHRTLTFERSEHKELISQMYGAPIEQFKGVKEIMQKRREAKGAAK